MSTVYERLKALQIILPDVPPPVVDGYVAAFVPFVRTGDLIYLSGRLAKKDGKPWFGKLGEQITLAEGKRAARGVAGRAHRQRPPHGGLWRGGGVHRLHGQPALSIC